MIVDSNLFELVKKYLRIKREESLREKKLRRFNYALESLDIDSINDYLNDGISIENAEKEGSVLSKLLQGYERYLFNILDDYRRKIVKKKDSEFFHEYAKWSAEDLPDELKELIEPLNNAIVNLLEILYQNGANINHNTYLGYSDNIFSDKRVVREAPSVMQYVMNCFYYSKQMPLIDWILSKEELVLEPKMIKQSLYQDNHDSVLLLDRLLDRGFKDNGYNFFELPFLGELGMTTDIPDSVANIRISPLVECITHDDMAYRQEKFNVLWEHASELEKRETKENWKMDSVIIPDETVGFEGDSSPLRM